MKLVKIKKNSAPAPVVTAVTPQLKKRNIKTIIFVATAFLTALCTLLGVSYGLTGSIIPTEFIFPEFDFSVRLQLSREQIRKIRSGQKIRVKLAGGNNQSTLFDIPAKQVRLDGNIGHISGKYLPFSASV
eukprot:CAMPEP_0202458380 /NCGR_PEP_ID=MMETSP1360-20130828/24506_1 /ASSEMBLY_ACC=CAM_ASM_000848 /TAXON_ID=515479 /ORGANISM="Licmophora paradoxa, Strain CCMP2313" /LENGTH=129 /DNA_ID=CAMNT_0049078891 /DNA_START=36 /DNA_END=425 /DNA_ORIENTATION=-